MIGYFEQHQAQLDEDSQRRLNTNPLRILDSKNPALFSLIASAPKLADYLDEASAKHFQVFQDQLQILGISFVINPNLVRGLDYYSHIVYEWTTDSLGAQGTVCAGGRYDSLISTLGGQPTPGCGFAMGIYRDWETDRKSTRLNSSH